MKHIVDTAAIQQYDNDVLSLYWKWHQHAECFNINKRLHFTETIEGRGSVTMEHAFLSHNESCCEQSDFVLFFNIFIFIYLFCNKFDFRGKN